ncbi:hypothetical protein DASC09_021450 [Saccharomycopsis crataegensis]|uniref:Homing endonuclease LAGLIDADG domain-containing protein n=1 Tax=Saccharomycopsis crataegensis TaxID=43959 RepID=A0AAV5QKD3_9ASCO|nr:hypothetical protein DASC09_021450 [Saccharomycopsis crataegensis]
MFGSQNNNNYRHYITHQKQCSVIPKYKLDLCFPEESPPRLIEFMNDFWKGLQEWNYKIEYSTIINLRERSSAHTFSTIDDARRRSSIALTIGVKKEIFDFSNNWCQKKRSSMVSTNDSLRGIFKIYGFNNRSGQSYSMQTVFALLWTFLGFTRTILY